MRVAAFSLLSFFACFPAFASARLPVVDVGAGSVSARYAFGEPVAVTSESPESRVQKGPQPVQTA